MKKSGIIKNYCHRVKQEIVFFSFPPFTVKKSCLIQYNKAINRSLAPKLDIHYRKKKRDTHAAILTAGGKVGVEVMSQLEIFIIYFHFKD